MLTKQNVTTLVRSKKTTLRTHSGRFTDLELDKLRGGYYTSPDVAAWLCSWAIRSRNDTVLEPSCGDGAFLRAASARLRKLGAKAPEIAKQLTGVEISREEAEHARASMVKDLGTRGSGIVEEGDFFAWWKVSGKGRFDAVVGNPPFIRYQTFPEPHRTRAMQVMVNEGLTPNKLTNIWVPFVVAAVASLRPGGRLALVLPAELLQVTYAGQLRSYITDRFTRVDIVACNELFFENAEQEVVLLLADGALAIASCENLCRVALTEAHTLEEIVRRDAIAILKESQPKTIQHDDEKWLKYFLTEAEIAFMRRLRISNVATPLSTHASVDVGVVTGKNEFFVLTDEQIAEHGLAGNTIPLISRSAHLRGARIGRQEWDALATSGERVHLLNLKGGKMAASITRYIRAGESAEIHKGYKCSIRKPWYSVPSIWVPDAFLFRQIYDFPRIVLNQADATSTDTIHRMSSKSADPKRIIANTYTWLTAASAEIEGRSYGGGVLELEPTEAERLLVPTELNGAMPLAECDRLVRAGRLSDVLEENARVVLMGHMGLTAKECAMLRGIWEKMRNRRQARRRPSKGNRSAPTALNV